MTKRRSEASADEFTPLTGPIKRRKFIVCDIESKDDDSQRAGFTRPFMMGVYDDGGEDREGGYFPFFDTNPEDEWNERYWQDGGSVDRAMRFMLQKKFCGFHIYAHNAGRFDYLFILPWLMNKGRKLGYSFSVIPVSSSIQVLDVWKGKKRGNIWRFVDSVRLIPTSLDKAAKAFGLQGKKKHDLNIPEYDQNSWRLYNGQDCTELHAVLEKFHTYVEDVLLGEVGITAPATAMKIFRRNYLKQAFPRSSEHHAFIRRGYFGGRVEPIETEACGLRYYDINSSYPAAMLEDMPAGVATEWEGEPPKRFLNGRIGFADVDVIVPPMHIPPLPVKAESGKLIFPTGKLSGVWDWAELSLALEMGCTIVNWRKSVWFEKFPIFKEYVENLYKYRDKSRPGYDAGLAEVVKIMLNGTYGKFGMKTLRKKLYLFDDPKLPDNAEPVTNDPESLVWTHEEECDAPYIMPQIAAHVTSLARIRLYRAMIAASCKHCWPERCHCAFDLFVAYSDTDSVITTATLPTSNELGALKDEIPEHSGRITGRFIAPKVYILGVEGDFEKFSWEGDDFEKVKAKGLEQRTRAVVEMLERGQTIFQKRLEKVGSLARSQFKRGPEMRVVPRRILPTTNGKRVLRDDGSSIPHELAMW